MPSPVLDQEKTLLFSEARFRALFRDVPTMVVILDASGKMILVNPRCTSQLGYTIDELEGQSVLKLFHEDDRAAVTEELQRCLENPNQVCRWQFHKVCKCGELLWVEETAQTVYDLNGAPNVLVVCQDVAKHKRMEEYLQESEERFHAMLNQVAVGIVDMGAHGRWLWINRKFCEIVGYTEEELKELTVKDITHPDDVEASLQHLQYLLDGKLKSYSLEKRYLRKNGSIVWANTTVSMVADPAGNPRYFIGVIEDITARKEAEKALQESEKKFSKAFQSMPSVLVIASLADGRYIEVNEAFERVIGYRRDEVIGRSSLDLSIWQNPEDRAIVLQMLAEGKNVRDLEIGFRSKLGTTLVGLYSADIIEIGAEQCLLSLVNDITARKEAEKALQESEKKFAKVFQATPICLTINSLSDGRYLEVNEAFERVMGYRRDEVIGRYSLDLRVWQNPEDRGKVLQMLAEGKKVRDFEIGLMGKSGNLLVGLLSAEIIEIGAEQCLLGMVNDITERKKAEEALRKSEEKFSKIFHSVPALIGITTLAEGRCIDINESGLRTLGYQREEIVGRTMLELGIWENKSARDQVIRALGKEGIVRDLELNFRGKNGKLFVGLFSAEPIDINGERYLLDIVYDITERKQMEEEIGRLNTDLAAANQELDAVNKEQEAFNHTVAHDLRQPLNLLSSYCQIIDKLYGGQLPEECRGYVQAVYNVTLRMDRLIGALLNFSQMGRVEPQREMVDLSMLAHEVSLSLKMTEPERQVDFRIADGIVANGDANLLLAVLNNLIGNAWKYTGGRGKAVIEFGVRDIGGVTTYFIRDNGAGFDMTDADKLFAPFQRLPGAEKCRGFGIGLATVERIIRRHGGRVWAEGVPDKGACFYFTLSAD